MVVSTRLLDLLSSCKEELVGHSNRLAADSNWDEAQMMIEWAKQIDGMVKAVSTGNGKSVGNHTIRRDTSSLPSPRGERHRDLPHYFVDGDRLVKVGASRDGGTYEHRVTLEDFEQVVDRLRDLSQESHEFETQRLVDRCGVPRHEPLIVVAVLEKQGLLIKQRRGRWQFANTSTFPSSVGSVWQRLPRQ